MVRCASDAKAKAGERRAATVEERRKALPRRLGFTGRARGEGDGKPVRRIGQEKVATTQHRADAAADLGHRRTAVRRVGLEAREDESCGAARLRAEPEIVGEIADQP